MNDRECKTQAEVNAAILAGERVILRDSARATLYGSARATLHGSASADLYGSASANLLDAARATLRDSARATLYDSARATLHGYASATLYDSTSATLYDSTSAVLYGSARAILRGSARADLYGSASADLYDSACAILHHSASATEGSTGRTLRQSRPVVVIGPLGSRNAMLSVYQCKNGGILVRAGCFLGSRDEFAAAVAKTHPTGQYADEYRAALLMIDALAAANAAQREAA